MKFAVRIRRGAALGRFYARLYSPLRLYLVFSFLLTAFLIFRRQERWLLWRPLTPAKLLLTIEKLGASFIKLAQVLATRADFFDENYLAVLRQLHDQLPPMPDGDFAVMFERAFKGLEPFAEFDPRPLACASIGQVHRALLKDGTPVAVKIRRRYIQRIARTDIRILNFFLALLRPLFAEHTRNSLEAVLNAFSSTILQEVDMARERANLEEFSRVYSFSEINFPRVFPEHSSVDALVMSFEEGCRFDDQEELSRRNLDFTELMSRLILFYTDQMLLNGYFHADPHPGNLLVDNSGRLVLVDFGMVSRISNHTRLAMINAVKAAYERDYELLLQAARQLGIITDQAPMEELNSLVAEVFRIFSDDNLSATNMQDLANNLLTSMQNQPFKLPQEIIYVMRVSSIIEGLGTTFVKNFNGIKDILPILKKNLPRALGESSLSGIVSREIRQLPLTLTKMRHVIEAAEQGELTVRLNEEDRQLLNRPLLIFLRRQLFTAMLVGAAFYLRSWPGSLAESASVTLFVTAVLRLVWQR